MRGQRREAGRLMIDFWILLGLDDGRLIGSRDLRAPVGLPDPPQHLCERAHAAWQFWREQLELMGLDHRQGACVN